MLLCVSCADGVSVTSSMVNSSVVVGSLTFSKVGSSQTGPYTCWGVNKYDNSSATINLRLHGEFQGEEEEGQGFMEIWKLTRKLR